MPYGISDDKIRVYANVEEYIGLQNIDERCFTLYGEISTMVEGCDGLTMMSSVGEIVKAIVRCNREDKDIEPEKRCPIKVYINSPGGDLTEGFALVDAIELSKTPVYTINVGQWSSMAFLIGIAGHKRISFPRATFLLHDGMSGAFGSTNKVQDRVKFDEVFEKKIVRAHVLSHSKMTERQYDAKARVEYYMLPEEALKLGFIDEIAASIDDVL